jgi:hypothetical protein
MTGIFFYSILIFILLSIFVPSIYTYAYKCFIGRIVLVLLIVYFSKHSIILGLVFVAIIIVTSMPLYEGFYGNNILAKNLVVTSNTSIKDITNNQEVFNYFTNYYCAKDSNGNVITPLGPNTDKLKRWNDILDDISSDPDSINIAISNKILQQEMCNPSTSQYYQNYNNNWSSTAAAASSSGSSFNPNQVTGCSTEFIDENAWCEYWAYDANQCAENPGYMLNSCAKSCNQVSGNPDTGSNYVFNMPKCLPQSIQTGICNDASIGNLISSAQSISNNPKLDPYLQQDGQWMLNMYSQLCPETSPVI